MQEQVGATHKSPKILRKNLKIILFIRLEGFQGVVMMIGMLTADNSDKVTSCADACRDIGSVPRNGT